MKRFLCLLLAAFMLCVFTVGASAEAGEAEAFPYNRIAVIDVSGNTDGGLDLEGILPLICYTDKNGGIMGAMFDALVFDCVAVPQTPEEAEGFITRLFAEGYNMHAADEAVGRLIDAGFAEKGYKYPVFAAVPVFFSALESAEDRELFCEYYVRTLKAVFASAGLENLKLAGVTFGKGFDNAEKVREECIRTSAENGMQTVIFTRVSGSTNADAGFTVNEKLDRRLSLARDYTGPVLQLGGVPADDGTALLDDLRAELDGFADSAVSDCAVAFSFTSSRDLYECAYSSSENAREAYRLIAEFADASNVNAKPASRVAKGAEYAIYAAIAVLSAVCMAVIVFVLVKKRKRNGKE